MGSVRVSTSRVSDRAAGAAEEHSPVNILGLALVALRSPRLEPEQQAASLRVIQRIASDGGHAAKRLLQSTTTSVNFDHALHQDYIVDVQAIRFAAAEAMEADPTPPPLVSLTDSPRLYHLPQVVGPLERHYLIETARPRLMPAGVRHKTDRRLEFNDQRVADQCELPEDDPVRAWLELRLSRLLRLEIRTAEPLTIVRYEEGGHFVPHCDAVHPLGATDLHRADAGGTRLASVVVYLNDDFTGGETAFVRRRLKIQPIAGDGIAFFNHRPGGEVDLDSMHAAMPVRRGEKWAALLWFREGALRENVADVCA